MSQRSHCVVIPVHDHAGYLREACTSVLAEGLGTDIIIVDDASVDDPRRTVADLPVRFFRRNRREGVAAARNFGVLQAESEFIFFLDADDRLAKDGLHWRLDFFASHPETQAVAGAISRTIDGAGNPLTENPFPWETTQIPASLTRSWARHQGTVQSAAWALGLRRTFFQALGGFDESLRHDPDTDFLLRALDLGPIPYIPRGVVEYRVHSTNHTRDLSNAFRQKAPVIAETWLANLAGRAR